MQQHWNPEQETALLLRLAIAQIKVTMESGDESITALANSFTIMMDNMQDISLAAQELENDMTADIIKNDCAMVSERIQSAIIAFQFYDKLSQRLAHLSFSLDRLSELVSNEEQLQDPSHWKALQDAIRDKYTLESDRHLFNAIVSGISLEDAVNMSHEEPEKPDDDIELF